MAVALPVPALKIGAATDAGAAGWTALAGIVAGFATLPLVLLLARPIAGLVLVAGSAHANDWRHAFVFTLLLVAPVGYALFVATAGELLKNRVSPAIHLRTIRVAAAGIVPYLVLSTIGVFWVTGPQQSFVVAAGLTIPAALVATIWASSRR